jgi:outer membrane beta-barrel protein
MGQVAPANPEGPSPNVAVHVVQRKPYLEKGKHEAILFPVAFQANPRFTSHTGTALGYVYHLEENFGLQLSFQYNWHTSESSLNRELLSKVHQEVEPASSLLLHWGAQAGVEVTPIYGKFAFYEGMLGQFSFVVNAGIGVGSTRHLLRPSVDDCSGTECRTLGATYGDTGLRAMGSIGAGFRFRFGQQWGLRLEVRDLLYSARVDKVNGCSAADLERLQTAAQAGLPSLSSADVGSGCNAAKFDGGEAGDSNRLNIPLALSLVKKPSSDILNNLGFYAGLSFIF